MCGLIWGVTGTRNGATVYQLASVAWLWSRYGIDVQHNGDCVGSDEQLYRIGRAFQAHIELHPPNVRAFRAFCGDRDDHWWRETDYLTRDAEIASNCDALVVCPKTAAEETRGGTWYTINYARKLKIPIAVVWPDGLITYENWTLEKIE